MNMEATDQTEPMLLSELVEDRTLPALAIHGLSVDSRQVKPGDLFAALKGVRDDGGRHIADALARGAVAILGDRDARADGDVPVVRVANPRQAIARMAARFYRLQPENLVAVTGTNGKSSVADMFRQLAGLLGHKAASIGTLGVAFEGATTPFGLTTPDAVTLHRTLAELSRCGVTHAAFEASSHGLAQSRVDGARLKAAAFTNLSRDHLDYHASLEDYLYAKLRLPGEILPPGATMVINADNPFSAEVEAIAWARGLEIFSVGQRGASLTLLLREPKGASQRLFLRYRRRDIQVDLPLIGAFQASNALVAAGLMIAVGEDGEKVIAALSGLAPVPGRLERMGDNRAGAPIYVDFAHSPDGLKTVIEAVRPHVAGKLHLVFGAGGDRDRGKRPLMGKVAAELADRVYVTDDNPRTEDPAAIRAEILVACPGAREVADRVLAIETAIRAAGKDDAVIVAGKGHETGQIVGDRTLPYSDAATVARILGEGA